MRREDFGKKRDPETAFSAWAQKGRERGHVAGGAALKDLHTIHRYSWRSCFTVDVDDFGKYFNKLSGQYAGLKYNLDDRELCRLRHDRIGDKIKLVQIGYVASAVPRFHRGLEKVGLRSTLKENVDPSMEAHYSITDSEGKIVGGFYKFKKPENRDAFL